VAKAKEDSRTNPFPAVDWNKVRDRGSKISPAATKKHDADMAKLNRQNDSKLR